MLKTKLRMSNGVKLKLLFISKLLSPKVQFLQHFKLALSYITGWRLNETMIKKTDAKSEIECILSCVKAPCCRSVNYRIGFGQSCRTKGNKDRCEMLHGIHDENYCSFLEKNENYNYIFLISPRKVCL